MRKLLKSKKALSPVVAAIILIAVTVAVSIAVAAWMGTMTFTFMETEECKITSAAFTVVADADNDQVVLTIINTGSTDVTFSSATVTGGGETSSIVTGGIAYGTSTPLTAGETEAITLTTSLDWVSGNSYNIEIVTAKGNAFTIKATA